MKRMNAIKKIITIGLLCIAVAVNAQQVDSAFVNAPQSVIPHIDRNAKFDLIDFYNANHSAKVRGMLESYVELTEKRSDFLKLVLTPVSTVELFIVPRPNGDYYILMIETVEGKAKDSYLTCFDSNWTRTDVPALTRKPGLEEFLKKRNKPKNEKVANALSSVPIAFVWASVANDSKSLLFHLDLKGIMSEDELQSVASYFETTIERDVKVKR
ncbi:hypothetical protein MASR1M31_16420 [Porphyromonadaceae bacterium]